MQASAYLGDLGGLSAYRSLVSLDLRGTGESAVPVDPRTYRCDRQVDDVEALRAQFGRAELAVQPSAGHFPWLDSPQWFARTLTGFLHSQAGAR